MCFTVSILREGKLISAEEYYASLPPVKKKKSFLQYLYREPITGTKDAALTLHINFSTASKLMDDFVSLGILVELTGFKRNRVFSFDNYIKLFR